MYVLDRQIGSLGLTVDELYIMWVKCSLNRKVGTALPINGKDTKKYREAVRTFNKRYIGKFDDVVDKKTQNALVTANQANEGYIKWVQKVLIILGYIHVTATGTIDSKTVKVIKDFQRRHKGPFLKKLKDDGWVGFKTEMALWKTSLIKPPCKSVPPPKPRPKCNKIKIVTDKMLYNKLIRAMEHLEDRYVGEKDRFALCLINKLLDPKTDDSFYDLSSVRRYFHGDVRETNPPNMYTLSMRSVLKKKMKVRWNRCATVTIEWFVKQIKWMKQDLLSVVNRMQSMKCSDPRTWSLRRDIYKRSRRPKSLYNCISSRIEQIKEEMEPIMGPWYKSCAS